jgi:hypothetical protein
MEIAKFPFKKIGKEYLGTIWRPYATVSIKAKNTDWIPVEMLVDSGADYTLLPRKYAELLGIDFSKCTPKTTLGIGGSETVYFYKSIMVRLGSWQKEIPVGFLARNDIPPLLGRLEFIEVLEVTFKDFKTIFKK